MAMLTGSWDMVFGERICVKRGGGNETIAGNPLDYLCEGWQFVYYSGVATTELASQWLDTLRPGTVRELFEHLPNMMYFAKDLDLRIMAGNRAFVQRCGHEREEDVIGLHDRDIFPADLAEKYSQDDRSVLATAKPLTGLVELFPNSLGEPEWYMTDKVPLFTREGKVAGLCGLVRSMKETHDEILPYASLAPVTEFLADNFADKVAVKELASMAGMSVGQLERRFRETFKTTPRQYVIKLRILRACELLSETTTPITEIALTVGFYDHSSFSRKFSELMGVTPSKYRQRFKK